MLSGHLAIDSNFNVRGTSKNEQRVNGLVTSKKGYGIYVFICFRVPSTLLP